MKLSEIEKAKRIAQLFIQRCDRLSTRVTNDGYLRTGDYIRGCNESGDVRRASMELSRQLAKMRR